MTLTPNIISDYQTDRRMTLKRQAVPLPDVTSKRCLDIGCDFGAWSWLLADAGAVYVLGLDRNRFVKTENRHVDLVEQCRTYARSTGRQACDFECINLGRQWRRYGEFDLVLMLSLYHHVFENVSDHKPIWYWLWQHVAHDGQLLWENPVSNSDSVVRQNVSAVNQANYRLDKIIGAAAKYFEAERIGPALHEPTREVWRFRPKDLPAVAYTAQPKDGRGGATKAFLYANSRRIKEIESVLGFTAFPGSLNLELDRPFDWDTGYYRAEILDPVVRNHGFDVDWEPRWARFYPVTVAQDTLAYAFRFEGEKYYKPEFVELIADHRLRNWLGDTVALCRH